MREEAPPPTLLQSVTLGRPSNDFQVWSNKRQTSHLPNLPEEAAMSKHSSVVPEEAVTHDWLTSVLEGAFYKVLGRDDRSIMVETEHLAIQLAIDAEKKAIVLAVPHDMKEEVNFLHAALAANTCNGNFGWARFYVLPAKTGSRHRLIVDCALPFARGINPYHIIYTMQMLERVAIAGFKKEVENFSPN